jgi:hypothetical protein
VTGLAVVLGRVSGDLACRDFDEHGGYPAWARRCPDLARRLPAARTKRGHHAFFRGPAGFDEYADGEYRADARHYVVLPPSEHPDGGRYEWVVPPDGAIPVVPDPVAVGLRQPPRGGTAAGRKRGARAAGTRPRPAARRRPAPAAPAPEGEAPPLPDDAATRRRLELAVEVTLPRAERRRHRAVFALARALKRTAALRGLPAASFLGLVREWHRQALAVVRTKDFDVTWRDFVVAWGRVKPPAEFGGLDAAWTRARAAGEPPGVAALFGAGTYEAKVAMLCRQLGAESADGVFPLALAALAALSRRSLMTASRAVRRLRDAGALVLVHAESFAGRRAREYCFRDVRPGRRQRC